MTMAPISFNSVLIIAGVSVLVPAVLGLLPRLPVPGAVLEVIAGIVVGPSVLNWARVDAPVQVLSTLGLGMLLFLAGLEIDVDGLRGPLGRLAGLAFCLSAALGLLGGFAFWLAGQATRPILLGIILMSTSAGLLLPLLKDAGQAATEFGQLIMTAAALAEIVPILLLSLLFSAAAKTPGGQLVSLAIFLSLLVLIGLAVARVRRLRRLDRMLDYLERRSGQLRVRAALTLALACGVLAYRFGFASILGAFAAGLLVRVIEVSGREPNPEFLTKLDGIGFGFLIPIFFISTGVAFQLKGLLAHPAALAVVPLYLVALLVVRAGPALFYARVVGRRRALAGGLLQATTLTFVIVATEIGLETGKLTPAASAALVTAGLLSAALFPAGAARLLAPRPQSATSPPPPAPSHSTPAPPLPPPPPAPRPAPPGPALPPSAPSVPPLPLSAQAPPSEPPGPPRDPLDAPSPDAQ
jgi:Kef-type K+ transport system membrane component KefB